MSARKPCRVLRIYYQSELSRPFFDTRVCVILRLRQMNLPHLHLVDPYGVDLKPRISASVDLAFRWVVRDYPQVDTALIANWAEEVGLLMQLRDASVHLPDRYAYAALKGKVCDWLRTKTANEEVAGIGTDLERLGGFRVSFQEDSDRKILFEQVKSTLNERDRYILILLLDDKSSPAAVAEALGTSYPAAAKAIQRVKERIAAVLTKTLARSDPTSGPARLCESKG